MVSYRMLRRADVLEVQDVALKAWMSNYPRYGVSVSTVKRFVRERYSTDSFEKYVFPSIQKRKSQFYVATDEEKIIGYSNAGPGSWGWELYRIYLLPEYIGTGIGKKLLIRCERFLRSKKARKYHCYVYKKNLQGLAFYYRNDFVKLESKDKNRNEICLEKKLTVL